MSCAASWQPFSLEAAGSFSAKGRAPMPASSASSAIPAVRRPAGRLSITGKWTTASPRVSTTPSGPPLPSPPPRHLYRLPAIRPARSANRCAISNRRLDHLEKQVDRHGRSRKATVDHRTVVRQYAEGAAYLVMRGICWTRIWMLPRQHPRLPQAGVSTDSSAIH